MDFIPKNIAAYFAGIAVATCIGLLEYKRNEEFADMMFEKPLNNLGLSSIVSWGVDGVDAYAFGTPLEVAVQDDPGYVLGMTTGLTLIHRLKEPIRKYKIKKARKKLEKLEAKIEV